MNRDANLFTFYSKTAKNYNCKLKESYMDDSGNILLVFYVPKFAFGKCCHVIIKITKVDSDDRILEYKYASNYPVTEEQAVEWFNHKDYIFDKRLILTNMILNLAVKTLTKEN